jgi:hypothetical protein
MSPVSEQGYSLMAMDVDILKTVGQVAGLGGVAIGVSLIVFAEIIRKDMFPKLAPKEAYQLLQLIAFFVWSIAICGIGAWAYVSGTSPSSVTQVK